MWRVFSWITVMAVLLSLAKADIESDKHLIFPEVQCDSAGLGYALLFSPGALQTATGTTYTFTAEVLLDDESGPDTMCSFAAADCEDDSGDGACFEMRSAYGCDSFTVNSVDGSATGQAANLKVKVSPSSSSTDPAVTMSDVYVFTIECVTQPYLDDNAVKDVFITLASTTAFTHSKATATIPDGTAVTAVVSTRADAVTPGFTDTTADYTACSAAPVAQGPFARGTELALHVFHDPDTDTDFPFMLILSAKAVPVDPLDTTSVLDTTVDYPHISDNGCPANPAPAGNTGPASDVGPQGLGVCQVIPTAAFTFSALDAAATDHAIRYDMTIRFCQDTKDGRAACTREAADCPGARRRRRDAPLTNSTVHTDIAVSIEIRDPGRIGQPSDSGALVPQSAGGVCLSSGETVGVGVLILILLVVAAAVFIVGVMLMRRHKKVTEKIVYHDNSQFS